MVTNTRDYIVCTKMRYVQCMGAVPVQKLCRAIQEQATLNAYKCHLVMIICRKLGRTTTIDK
jgi:hypothetical protein